MKLDITTTPHELLQGLPPVCGNDPKVLILGSFPSVLSLEKRQYYANPHNRFWKIAEDLFSIETALPYQDRIDWIMNRDIALWDVIRCCTRVGSADNRIRDPVFNNISSFLGAHTGITLVALNGTTAARYFHKACRNPGIDTILLPSTSPAHARVRYQEKLDMWRIVQNVVG